jgi:hypothetical protein
MNELFPENAVFGTFAYLGFQTERLPETQLRIRD